MKVNKLAGSLPTGCQSGASVHFAEKSARAHWALSAAIAIADWQPIVKSLIVCGLWSSFGGDTRD